MLAFDDGGLTVVDEHRTPATEKLVAPHPLVLASKRHMEVCEPSHNGLIDGASENTLTMRVGRKSVARGLRLFDAIVKQWEQMGGVVAPARSWFDKSFVTSFSFGPDHVYLRLDEKTNVKDKIASRSDREHTPSGLLVFSVVSYAEGLRKNWSDGKRQILEDCLDALMKGLLAHAEELRLTRLDKECIARQHRAARERHEFSKRADEAETQRREELIEQVKGWHQAQDIRLYLDHIKDWVESGLVIPRDCERHEKWCEWAYWYAALLDPTCSPGDSPLAEAPPGPVNKVVDGLDFTRMTRRAITATGIRDTDSLSRLTNEELRSVWAERPWVAWDEIGRVLEAMGYDVVSRKK